MVGEFPLGRDGPDGRKKTWGAMMLRIAAELRDIFCFKASSRHMVFSIPNPESIDQKILFFLEFGAAGNFVSVPICIELASFPKDNMAGTNDLVIHIHLKKTRCLPKKESFGSYFFVIAGALKPNIS